MQMSEAPALVPTDPNENVTDLLEARVTATPERILFSIPEGGDQWRHVTAKQFHEHVISVAKGFVAAGVNPGDKIGFVARTTYEWTLIDFALSYAGAILIPIYESSAPAQIQWILEDSESIGFIAESAEHFARFDEIASELPQVKHTWQMHLGALETLISQGAAVDDAEIERRRSLAKAADVATIIYTSGSTGKPKGCTLTHSNFVDTVRNSAEFLPEVVYMQNASMVLFITAAHVFARFISMLCIHAGVRTGHEPDTKKLVETLGSFKPTFLLAVPRVFEKVYNSAEQKAEAAGKGKIFRAAASVAIEHSKLQSEGKKIPFLLKIKFALFDRLVYAKLRNVMGGNVAYAVSGSAPLGARLGHFYNSLGITILEGYGLTETTAPTTINTAKKSVIGTVGLPIPGMSVRISDENEVQIRGVNIFQEYWKNPEATAEAFDDGWFRTGDLGSLDENGYLTITGRKKEIIVTAGGKNVAPAGLEDPIRANPIVSQVVAVGDKKPFIGALVTLDPEMLPTWLANNGLAEDMSLKDAATHPQVRAEIQRAIDIANSKVSRAESIRKFVILPTELSEESGHLTPKMSIKRNVIVADFAETIEELYASGTETESVSVTG